ncbi:MAG: GspE/PulE family protein, partial [Armatimonadota bacterium]|nr:GspE/PulE family protein [Armatimonadota bacterium]
TVIAVDDVRLMPGQEVEPVITTEDDLLAAINRHYQMETASEAVAQEALETAESSEDEVSIELLKTLVEDAPVVRLLNTIIDEGIRQGASDIHIEPQRTGLLVRYRIDGVLHDVMKPPRDVRAALISRAKIMADLDIAERRRPQDGRIHYKSPSRTVDLRVSTLPTIFGEKVVMRILDQSTPLIGLNRLGFHSDTLRQWEQAISTPYGMILVTGPTGSGKTTTLYATLGTINSLEKNIVTVEDPVEYQLPRINQVQVNVKAGLTFASALRSILRQDPDIVMVGEMRDRETAEIGVQAALTGHLVLSTLHTNDAASAITRLVDMGIEPFLVASSTVAILAQRLARQICPHCKIAYTPPPDALKRLGLDPQREVSLFRGQGCEECRFTGYRGRIGVFELLMMSDAIRELVVRRAPSSEIKALAVREGMQTLRDDGLEKVLSGVSTIDEILRVVYVAD